MKRVKFHPAARAEFREAILFYDERATGLGHQFTEDVENAVQRIREMPAAHPIISKGIRRCVLPRFPYSVLFRADGTQIEIMALMHQRRHPDAWKER